MDIGAIIGFHHVPELDTVMKRMADSTRGKFWFRGRRVWPGRLWAYNEEFSCLVFSLMIKKIRLLGAHDGAQENALAENRLIITCIRVRNKILNCPFREP